ncbi:DUF1707 domain-containing protein [Kribbella soli]
MGDQAALEHALLEHLQVAPLTRAELARRTGASERWVQSALDDLVRGTYVVRRPQDAGPADYEITAAGSGRLEVVEELLDSPLKMMGKVFVATVRDTVRPRQVQPADPRDLWLSDDDKAVCGEALAAHYVAGRIDRTELERRSDLLSAGKTRRVLEQVFDGLPLPNLTDPVTLPPGSNPPTWGSVALLLLPVLCIVLFIAGSIWSSHASLPTAVLFTALVVGVLLWQFRGGRGRK